MFEPVPLPQYRVDPFQPVLFTEVTPYDTSEEQNKLILDVLLISSSDSFFAAKAYNAIRFIIGRAGLIPVINTLEPATKASESPTFKMKCKGSGFSPASVIHINGNPVITTFVAIGEISTDISLVGVPPGNLEIVVRSGEGVLSNPKTFVVT
jgi:hypothetical protein